MSNNTPDMNGVLDRIVKLLKLAGNNPNPHEAAAAAAKAQEIMTQYNLDMGSVERKSGASDEKREKEAVYGGFYKYNRDLYKTVAELNFCVYWTTEEWIQCELPPKNTKARNKWKAEGCPEDFKVFRKVHKILGRKVNVASTKVMAGYLEQAVERILREEMDAFNYGTNMIFSKWAFSFREGAVANIIERIQEERERAEKERAKKAKEEAMRASHPGAAPATGTALTLLDYTKSEEIGNYDARWGEGSWARRVARQAEYQSEWDKGREKREQEAHYEIEGMKCFEIFHPELFAKMKEKAAKEAEKEAERNRKYWEREDRKEYREHRKRDHSAYASGKEKAEKISLNQQLDHETKKQIK